MTSLFHLTGVFASVVAGILADRLGRTPVIFGMANLSMLCSFGFGWLIGGPVWIVVGRLPAAHALTIGHERVAS